MASIFQPAFYTVCFRRFVHERRSTFPFFTLTRQTSSRSTFTRMGLRWRTLRFPKEMTSHSTRIKKISLRIHIMKLTELVSINQLYLFRLTSRTFNVYPDTKRYYSPSRILNLQFRITKQRDRYISRAKGNTKKGSVENMRLRSTRYPKKLCCLRSRVIV